MEVRKKDLLAKYPGKLHQAAKFTRGRKMELLRIRWSAKVEMVKVRLMRLARTKEACVRLHSSATMNHDILADWPDCIELH